MMMTVPEKWVFDRTVAPLSALFFEQRAGGDVPDVWESVIIECCAASSGQKKMGTAKICVVVLYIVYLCYDTSVIEG